MTARFAAADGWMRRQIGAAPSDRQIRIAWVASAALEGAPDSGARDPERFPSSQQPSILTVETQPKTRSGASAAQEMTRDGDARSTARVTVVVPCYNQAHYLSECLTSLVEQSFPHWEAIVVDDESPDGADIEQAIARIGDARIRLHRHTANLGLGGSRNTGIREARTELVLPVDADDRIAANSLEALVSMFDADPELDCAYGDVRLFGRTVGVLEFPGPPAGKKMLRAEDTIPGAGTMMRRALWERLGGYDESEVLRRGREDFEFWIRAFDTGCKAGRVRQPLYEYRILPSSMNISCRLQDDVIADYIYAKHKALFDEAGEAIGFKCFWTDKAAMAHYEQGMRMRAAQLAFRAWRMRPSASRMKGVLRTMLPFSVNHAIGAGEIRRRVPFAGYPLRGKARHRPFFVIGARHSGGSELRLALDAHSRLHVPPETYVLGQCVRKFKRYGRKLNWHDLVALLLAQFEFHPSFHAFDVDLQPLAHRLSWIGHKDRNLAHVLDAFYRHHAEAHGKTPLRWGDKTSMNSLDDASMAGREPSVVGAGTPETLSRLLATFPDAQFLHVVRDGCDLVHSHLRGGLYGRVDEAAKRWLHIERQTRRFAERHREQSIDVRYEDLASNPEGTLRGVCAFLDVEFEAEMAVGRFDRAHNPGDPRVPGKGRRNFSAQEREELQRLIGADLAELGYPPATDPVPASEDPR